MGGVNIYSIATMFPRVFRASRMYFAVEFYSRGPGMKQVQSVSERISANYEYQKHFSRNPSNQSRPRPTERDAADVRIIRGKP